MQRWCVCVPLSSARPESHTHVSLALVIMGCVCVSNTLCSFASCLAVCVCIASIHTITHTAPHTQPHTQPHTPPSCFGSLLLCLCVCVCVCVWLCVCVCVCVCVCCRSHVCVGACVSVLSVFFFSVAIVAQFTAVLVQAFTNSRAHTQKTMLRVQRIRLGVHARSLSSVCKNFINGEWTASSSSNVCACIC